MTYVYKYVLYKRLKRNFGNAKINMIKFASFSIQRKKSEGDPLCCPSVPVKLPNKYSTLYVLAGIQIHYL